jgi:biopolymer transport protein ExbD
MKLESTLDRRPALLHLAPVLDVMALMVVFLLMGSRLIYQSGVGIDLPVSSSQLPPLDSARVVLITASDPPTVLMDRQQMTLDALVAELERGPSDSRDVLYLKMDRRLPSGVTMRATDAALQGGFKVYQTTDQKGRRAALPGSAGS